MKTLGDGEGDPLREVEAEGEDDRALVNDGEALAEADDFVDADLEGEGDCGRDGDGVGVALAEPLPVRLAVPLGLLLDETLALAVGPASQRRAGSVYVYLAALYGGDPDTTVASKEPFWQAKGPMEARPDQPFPFEQPWSPL